MGRRITYILASVVIICTLISTETRISNSDDSIMAIYRGQKVEVDDADRLITLVKEYANLGEERILNQAIDDTIINEFGKRGLKIKVSLIENDIKVGHIYVVEDQNKWMVVRNNDIDTVLYLTESELMEIYRCIEIPL